MTNITKPEIRTLVEQIYNIDHQILNPPPREKSLLSKVFGVSDHERRRIRKEEKERVDMLLRKKASTISSFLIPKSDDGLNELAQLALANFKSAEGELEKQAWKNKLEQVLVRMQAVINADATDSLADEFLFLTNEFEKIKKQEEAQRKNKFAIIISLVIGASGVLLGAMFNSQVIIGIAIVLIVALWVYRLFIEMNKSTI